jgi:hypothetical protein
LHSQTEQTSDVEGKPRAGPILGARKLFGYLTSAIKIDGFLIDGPGPIKKREQPMMKNVTELDKSVVVRLELSLMRVFRNVAGERAIRSK